MACTRWISGPYLILSEVSWICFRLFLQYWTIPRIFLQIIIGPLYRYRLTTSAGSIYLVDLFLEFHIGFMVRWDMETVTIIDGIEIAKRYVTKGSFVIDFLACAPIFIQLGLALSSSAESNRSVAQLLMLLRLLRLLRVVNLIMVSVWNWFLCMIFWTCLIISVLYQIIVIISSYLELFWCSVWAKLLQEGLCLINLPAGLAHWHCSFFGLALPWLSWWTWWHAFGALWGSLIGWLYIISTLTGIGWQ